jgi:hypothetical protein
MSKFKLQISDKSQIRTDTDCQAGDSSSRQVGTQNDKEGGQSVELVEFIESVGFMGIARAPSTSPSPRSSPVKGEEGIERTEDTGTVPCVTRAV